MRLHGKRAWGLRIRPLDDPHLPAHLTPQVVREWPAVARIRPDFAQARQRRSIDLERVGHQPCALAVLRIGGRNDHLEDEALGVYKQMALAPHYLLVRVVAAETPF